MLTTLWRVVACWIPDWQSRASAERRCIVAPQAALGPLVLFDVEAGREETRGSGSTENYEEVSFVVALLSAYFAAAAAEPGSVAVITPYKAQVRCLNAAWRAV